jgi:pyruvate kinase
MPFAEGHAFDEAKMVRINTVAEAERKMSGAVLLMVGLAGPQTKLQTFLSRVIHLPSV